MSATISNCPNCGAEVSVDDQHRGFRLSCPFCRNIFRTDFTKPEPAPPFAVPVTTSPTLYVLLNGNTRGPLTQDQVLDMVRQGQLIGETPAWKEGLADWKRLDQIVNLTVAGSATPPLPSQQTKANPAVIQSQRPFTPAQPAAGARPGLRFLARCTDFILFSECIYLVALLAAPRLIPANHSVRAMVFAFLWCFVEAGLLSTWGMTPGKALLKVQVRKANGSVLSYFDALARAFDVWLRGMGLCLPLIGLIAWIAGYQRLTTKGTTSWDEKGNYQVTHGSVGPVRLAVAIIVVVLAFVFGVVDLLAAKGAGGR